MSATIIKKNGWYRLKPEKSNVVFIGRDIVSCLSTYQYSLLPDDCSRLACWLNRLEKSLHV